MSNLSLNVAENCRPMKLLGGARRPETVFQGILAVTLVSCTQSFT